MINVNSLYRNVEKTRDPQSTDLLKGNLNLSTITLKIVIHYQSQNYYDKHIQMACAEGRAAAKSAPAGGLRQVLGGNFSPRLYLPPARCLPFLD